MGSAVTPKEIAIIEQFQLKPTYCSGAHQVHLINGNMHYLMYVDQPSTDNPGTTERIANVRLIVPLSAVMACHRLVAAAISVKDALGVQVSVKLDS